MWDSLRSASPLLRQTSDETAANALATVSYHHDTLLLAWEEGGARKVGVAKQNISDEALLKCVSAPSLLHSLCIHYVFFYHHEHGQ